MQISSANILIAAQQAAKQAPQTKPVAKPFADALADHGKGDNFAPLDFKQTAASAARPAAAQTPAVRPGSQLDIRI
jgi:hypothetical protein